MRILENENEFDLKVLEPRTYATINNKELEEKLKRLPDDLKCQYFEHFSKDLGNDKYVIERGEL